MKMAEWWAGTEAFHNVISDDDASIELNRDFDASKMLPSEAAQLVQVWMQGGISKSTLIYNFQTGELLPPNRSIEGEMELIEEQAPAMAALDLEMKEKQVSAQPDKPPAEEPADDNPEPEEETE
jgi:hypothetical protein